jgi:hypothetical protein
VLGRNGCLQGEVARGERGYCECKRVGEGGATSSVEGREDGCRGAQEEGS